MGKAKWWVCDNCHSLNDLPANKCYNCHDTKPDNPREFDDQYGEVQSQQRVGITVDLSQVGDLSRPDPIETQAGGAIMEAFGEQGAQTAEDASAEAPERDLYDPYAPAPVTPAQPAGSSIHPLRDPVQRGIDQLGGQRKWAEGSDPAVPPPSVPQAPPPPVAPTDATAPPPAAMPRLPVDPPESPPES